MLGIFDNKAIGLSNLKKDAAFRVFRGSQRLGLSVLPRHYYVPVKDRDIIDLRQDVWAKPAGFDNVDGGDLDQQLSWLKRIVDSPRCEGLSEIYGTAKSAGHGPGYGFWDSYVLANFIQTHRPNRVVEVGAGVSTNIIQWAAAQVKHDYQHTCIDPYPSDFLRQSKVELVESFVQNVDLSEFESLGAGDLLFIDSTHTVALGSDVNHLISLVLPTLADGVFVHIHDIFFPFLYSRHVANTIFDWQESTLVHALIMDSTRYRMLASLSMLDWGCTEEVSRLLPLYAPAQCENGLLEHPPWQLDTEQAPSALYLEVSNKS